MSPKTLTRMLCNEISEDYQCDISNFEGTVIRNPYIRVAQRLLTCGLFAREDSLNVPHQSELYFLYSMPQGNRLNPSSFLVNQLHSVATSSV